MSKNYGYIEVDFIALEKAISEIENYLKQIKSNMSSAQELVDTLLGNCYSPDLFEFKKHWESGIAEGSTYSELCKALELYASYLRFVKKQYKNIQTKVNDRACRL